VRFWRVLLVMVLSAVAVDRIVARAPRPERRDGWGSRP